MPTYPIHPNAVNPKFRPGGEYDVGSGGGGSFGNIVEAVNALIAQASKPVDTSYITDFYAKQRTAAENRANKQADTSYSRAAVQRGFSPNDAYSQKLRSELFNRYFDGTDDALVAGEAGAIAQARQAGQATQVGLIPMLLSIWKMQQDRAMAEQSRTDAARAAAFEGGGGGGGGGAVLAGGSPQPGSGVGFGQMVGQDANPNAPFYSGGETRWMNGQLVPAAQWTPMDQGGTPYTHTIAPGGAVSTANTWNPNATMAGGWQPNASGYGGSYGRVF